MNHPDLFALADYWLASDEAPDLEEHLFECAECSATLEWLARTANGVRAVVRKGDLAWVLTPEFMSSLAEEGLRIRSYAPPNGGGVQCTITAQDDLLMARLQSDLASVTRLDAIVSGPDGTVLFRLEDMAFRQASNAALVLNQPVSQAKASGDGVMVFKLVSVEPNGDRAVGEFTFNHTRTIE